MRLWPNKGQQMKNDIRVHICQGIKKGMPITYIARYIRTHVKKQGWKLFSGTGKGDKEYNAILQKNSSINEYLKYKHATIIYLLGANPNKMDKKEKRKYYNMMSSTSLKPKTRGRKVLKSDYETEGRLIQELQKMWDEEKRVWGFFSR